MKKVMLSIMVLLAVSLTIQAAGSPMEGLLKGRILDKEKNPLPGAVVIIDSNRHSVTDVNGFYSFLNLPLGNHNLEVSYIGFAPVSKIVAIAAIETTEDVVMSDTSQVLDEIVITGVFSGQRKAINTQKNNLNITNVVAADQIGKFPDSNIGDALKRISGINVQYDQGEARFGQVRGTPTEFSSVTVNGSRIPSAEGDIRNVQLDLIPSDMIQTIEVNKTLMPDQDGDAIGGSINLVTKSSPCRFSLSAVAGSGYNWISRKAQMNFGLTAGNRFFNDCFGVMLAASYNNAPVGSYNTEFLWEKKEDGTPYINDYQIRQYFVTRERQSYSLSLDYIFNDLNKMWFKGIFNNRNDWENRYRTTLKDISPDGEADVRIQTKGGGSGDERDARLERQRTMDFTLGGENQFGWLGMDWKIGYARASEQRPNERYIDYRLKSQQFSFDLSNPREPFAIPDEGSTMILNKDCSLKELTQQQEDIVEEDGRIALDFKTELSDWSKLKFGFKFVSKSKDKEIDFYEYTPTNKKAFNAEAFGHTVNQSTDRFMPSPKYQTGIFVSKNFLGSLNLGDASLFDKEQVTEELAGNYHARENVTSGYIRIDSRIADNLHFMGGLRVENTDIRYIGRIYDDETNTVSKTGASSSYINFLPSLLLKWEINKDFLFRAGYNQLLSRPKYSALVSGMNIKRGDNEIKIGNPGLKATTSHNFDLSSEYYWKSIGLVTAGLFYKKIEGFIIDEVAYNKEYDGNVWTKLTQPKNGGNANILGAELAWQRDFSFITPAMKCVGLYATYTYTHSRITDFNFEGRENEKKLSLHGSPAHTANLSLYFEKSGVAARLSFNYASAFIDEMGASAFYDRYYDEVKYMDFNISYTFGEKTKFTLYTDCINLLNQPLRYYQGSKNYTMQHEYYGVKLNGGIKMTF